MRWHAEWWGIVIVAESDDDAELLDEMKRRIPHDAKTNCDDGTLWTGEEQGSDWVAELRHVEPDEKLLVFFR